LAAPGSQRSKTFVFMGFYRNRQNAPISGQQVRFVLRALIPAESMRPR
jgi:hypothetical protein